jgi:hypothetical protein
LYYKSLKTKKANKAVDIYEGCNQAFVKADSVILKANIIFKVIKVKITYSDSTIFYNDYLMSKSAQGGNSAILPSKNSQSGMIDVIVPHFILPLTKN